MFDNGEVKIADFGLAKKVGQKLDRIEVRGTPLFMAPESVNENEYDSPCDIWALGCAVLEMITGKPAWNCKADANIAALLIKIGVSDELPEIPQDLSKEGKDFLSKCFVKDPTRRWTADMLLDHPYRTTKNQEKHFPSPFYFFTYFTLSICIICISISINAQLLLQDLGYNQDNPEDYKNVQLPSS